MDAFDYVMELLATVAHIALIVVIVTGALYIVSAAAPALLPNILGS